MKILFITSPEADNLQDGLLHGFRVLFGEHCIDYPKKDIIYNTFPETEAANHYGRLFTLWRTLPDIHIDRTDIISKVKKGEFNLIIIGSVHRVQTLFKTLLPYLKRTNTIIIDGEDVNAVMRFAALRFLYFKRELTPKTSYYFLYKTIPPFIYNIIRLYPSTIIPTAFCIPKEKITEGINSESKETLFQSHIVDNEIISSPLFENNNNTTGYLFDNEAGYYTNLQKAKFGITTKRGGWDCLRHYEIAANGTVQCFKQLSQKPTSCAPHGLADGVNIIEYRNAEHLAEKINALSDDDYAQLLHNTYEWIKKQTTEIRAVEILNTYRSRILERTQ